MIIIRFSVLGLLMGIVSSVSSFQITPFHFRNLVARRPIKLAYESDLPFQECWNANALKLNPLNDTRINTMLQRLCSPAPQSYFIFKRFIQTRKICNNTIEELNEIQYLLKPGYQWAFDLAHGTIEIISCGNNDQERKLVPLSMIKQQSTMDLAREALNALERSKANDNNMVASYIENLAKAAKDRLKVTLGTDIRGRSSADVAFSFALAGVDDAELYRILGIIAWKELERVGIRPSFHSRYILQIIEKLAAAGLRDEAQNVHRVAANCLEYKGEHLDVVDILRGKNGAFDLHSPRSLLWLWRSSSRKMKVKEDMTVRIQKQPSPQWIADLDDPKRPLVVDIGCGMGVSVLGLAATALHSDKGVVVKAEGDHSFLASKESVLINSTKLMEANYVGCDVSKLNTGYAQGIANRWKFENRVQFVCQSGQKFLEEIEEKYPGEIALILIQFPTPFKFQGNTNAGNSQLPQNLEDGFLVNTQLLHTVASILKRSHGYFLLQSNVEDVAVTMCNTALSIGFKTVQLPNYRRLTSILNDDKLPQRTVNWIQLGGERAVGDSWSAVPLLPSRGATETEVSCNFSGTHIHRCLLEVS